MNINFGLLGISFKGLTNDINHNIKKDIKDINNEIKEIKNNVLHVFCDVKREFSKLIGLRITNQCNQRRNFNEITLINPYNYNNVINNHSKNNINNIDNNNINQNHNDYNNNNINQNIINNNRQNNQYYINNINPFFNNNINYNNFQHYNNNYNNNQNNNNSHYFNNNYNNIQIINNNINDNNNLNNNYDNNEENLVDFIDPDKKHLRGLVNIASTCYMNSILQCFINIKELAVYFQSEKITNLSLIYKDDNQKLFPSFQEVIKELWDPWDKSPYSPNNFKKRLGQMNPLFQGALPNDAKDLLTFILLQLHEELNKPKNNNDINSINYMNMQNDQKSMFKSFCKYFADNNRSIISGLFYGIFYNITQCTNGHIFYNYQTFNFIIFPLDKVLKYKIQSNNFISNFNNTVSLEDCFNYYEYPTILNDYYCNICNKQCNCNYISKFSIMPNIIIIILNRGRGLEHKVNISFQNENLGLSKFVEYFKEDSIYELVGLVTHYGDSSASGHFMARCKSPIDDEWYLYNDSIVQKIGYFNNETFAQGNPYILFYKKINFQK